MIFRRPNAFIIKHIKLIHVIILLIMGYLLYKTNEINSVYETVEKSKSIIGGTYAKAIFNPFMYITLLFSLVAVLAVMALLLKKKKKAIFHISLAILNCFMFIYYVLSEANIIKMQQMNVSAPTYLAYGDIAQILFYVQSVFVFILLFKATGFNIKTFSFEKVSYDLDLEDADSEEIEFNLEIDGNELKTKRRRKSRNLKYFYLENRWKLNLIGILIIGIIFVGTQMIVEAKKPIYYDLNNELRTRNYNIAITDIYLTRYDYAGKKINSNGPIIIVKFKVKKNFEQEYSFDRAYISVTINGKAYYAKAKYDEYFTDIGTPYKDQKLTQEYQDYYLTYEIPYEFSTKDIYIKISGNFDYTKNQYSYFEIKASYESLEKDEKYKEFKLNEEMDIDAYGVKTNVTISSFEIKEKFKLNFNAQIDEKNYNLVEYITPTAEDNEEKVIMKLKYEKSSNFADVLSKYAIIEYKIDDTIKEGKIYSFITPKLSKEENTYYVQVSKDVLKGENRVIKIKVRDQVFKYELD